MKYVGILVALVIACLIGFQNCASGGGSSSTQAQSVKSLWSTWHNSNVTVNLTGGQIGVTETFNWVFQNGDTCGCDLNMAGTEESGNYSLSNCAFTAGPSDPGCSSLNQSGTYQHNNSTLDVCDAGGCVHYN